MLANPFILLTKKTEEISTLSAKFHFEYFSNAPIFPNKSELWLPTAWRLCHRSVGGRPGRRRSSGGRVRTYVSRTDDFLVDYAPNFGNIHGDHGARGWGRRLVSVSFLIFFAGSFVYFYFMRSFYYWIYNIHKNIIRIPRFYFNYEKFYAKIFWKILIYYYFFKYHYITESYY